MINVCQKHLNYEMKCLLPSKHYTARWLSTYQGCSNKRKCEAYRKKITFWIISSEKKFCLGKNMWEKQLFPSFTQ